MADLQVVIAGVGAAGVAIAKILMEAGVPDIIGVRPQGRRLRRAATTSTSAKQWFAENTNPERLHRRPRRGAARRRRVHRRVGARRSSPPTTCARWPTDPIVFAMANPDPEIRPEDADDIAAVIATGRSDYPNQINNVLAFPGIFRGALDAGATTITEGMKLAAAKAIAAGVSDDELAADFIIPSVFDPAVAPRGGRGRGRGRRRRGRRPAPPAAPALSGGPCPGFAGARPVSSSRRGCRAGGSGRATGWRGRPRSGAGA